jgi:nucleotide-binding universal stress UspA family protein
MPLLAPNEVDHSGHREADAAAGRTAVVGHDGSTAAAEVLAHAAQRVGPEGYLIVVHALPLGVSTAEVRAGYERVVRSVLRSIEGALPESVSYETRIVAGPASRALLDVARRCEADEIVLGAAARPAARGATGRVSDAVLRHSERPVTIVPRTRARAGWSTF